MPLSPAQPRSWWYCRWLLCAVRSSPGVAAATAGGRSEKSTPGPPAESTIQVRCEVAAVQQISELKFTGATKIVPLPDELQVETIFTLAVLNGTTRADSAAQIVRALTSPEAAAAYERSGASPLFK